MQVSSLFYYILLFKLNHTSYNIVSAKKAAHNKQRIVWEFLSTAKDLKIVPSQLFADDDDDDDDDRKHAVHFSPLFPSSTWNPALISAEFK